jgi:predicted SnoaL-like aldol condensation-catalyzing enzyme
MQNARNSDRASCRSAWRTMLAVLVLGGSVLNPLGAAISSNDDTRSLVERFADQFYARKDVPGAFATFVDSNYIQHNPGLSDGRAAAVAALTPMFSASGALFDVKHILVDGDLALIHLFGRGDPATRGAVVFDLYRINGPRLVEHWDVIQPIKDSVSDPLASSSYPAASVDDTVTNRSVMKEFIRLLYERKQLRQAYETYVAPDFIDHTPGRNGRQGAVGALTPLFANPDSTFEVKHVLVDRNFAAVHYHGRLQANNPGAAVVELFRLENGKIVEHWDAFQPIPSSSQNAHPMF